MISYDNGAADDPKGEYVMISATQGWGPNGHMILDGGYTVHWDGDMPLFITNGNSSSNINVLNFAGLGAFFPYHGLTFYVLDREFSGAVTAGHNSSGTTGWAYPNRYHPVNATTLDCLPAGNCPPEFYTYFSLNSPDGLFDGTLNFQGARAYDPAIAQWTTPDAYHGDIDDPMSQKSYLFNRNNPVDYADPSGFCSDPGGSGIRTCADFFIASEWTVLTRFAGDNRSFGNFAPGHDTFRVGVDVNFKDQTVHFRIADTHSLTGSDLGRGQLLVQQYQFVDKNTVRISVEAKCGARECRYAPHISASFTETLNKNGTVTVSGDRTMYPSMEVWQYSDSGPPKADYEGGEAVSGLWGLLRHTTFESGSSRDSFNPEGDFWNWAQDHLGALGN